MGYLTVYVVGLTAFLIVFMVSGIAGPASVDLGVGPFPLASMWHSGAGFGFQTQWALGAFSLIGAAAGFTLALRRQTSPTV